MCFFQGLDPVFYDGRLRTSQFDPTVFSEPEFLFSFESEEYVYFFFREFAVENANNEKVSKNSQKKTKSIEILNYMTYE